MMDCGFLSFFKNSSLNIIINSHTTQYFKLKKLHCCIVRFEYASSLSRGYFNGCMTFNFNDKKSLHSKNDYEWKHCVCIYFYII